MLLVAFSKTMKNPVKMKRKKVACFLVFVLFSVVAFGQESFSLLSWNIRDFGKTKDKDEILMIAEIVKGYDIVAIQEVVAGYGGAQAVARLADQLNRMGHKWDYTISNPTQSPPYKAERYAFLWKTPKITLENAWLDKKTSHIIDREPFLARFRIKGKTFTIANYHSRPYTQNPEAEIACFYDYPGRFSYPIIIAGDFNADTANPVFIPLYKMGFVPNMRQQKTTLKRKCDKNDNYKNHAIDFILYPKKYFRNKWSGVIDFVGSCDNLTDARLISDHLAVVVVLGIIL